ncbi:hypothetical protein HA402_009815 [Bradysia odoriphaga]|nr:hypothetical protein HA402_009815 [Bradysia odoriphaga]
MEEEISLNEVLLRKWTELPQIVKDDPCFNDYRAVVRNKRQESTRKPNVIHKRFLFYFKITILGIVWLLATVTLLTHRPKVLDEKLLSLPQGDFTEIDLPEATASKYLTLFVTGHFTETDEPDCLDCIAFKVHVHGNQKSYATSPAVWKLTAINESQHSQKNTKRNTFGVVESINDPVNITVTVHNNMTFNIPIIITYDANVSPPLTGVLLAVHILIFLYGLIIWDVVHRTFAAVLSAVLSIACLATVNDRPTAGEIISWIDFETILLLFSMMIVVSIIA